MYNTKSLIYLHTVHRIYRS